MLLEFLFGYAIAHPELAEVVLHAIEPHTLKTDIHAKVFKALQEIIKSGKVTDLTTLSSYFLEDTETLYECMRYEDMIVSKSTFDNHLKLYKDNALKERLIFFSESIPGIVKTNTLEDSMARIEEDLFSITSSYTRVDSNPYLMYRNGLDGTTIRNSMVPFGIKTISDIIYGIAPTDLCIIGGRPGMGKTTLALNILYKYAFNNPSPKLACMFSLEMSSIQLINKLVCLRTGISSSAYRDGLLTSEEVAQCSKASEDIENNSRLVLYDQSVTTISGIRSAVRQLARRHEIGLIVIDYLQLIGGSEGKGSVERVSHISRNLKLIAKEFNCAVIALSQLSRSLESRADKRPILSDLRESGSIEQDADSVVFLFDESYYDAERPETSLVEVNIAKNRHGSLGTAVTIFHKASGRFTSPSGGK